MNRGFVVATSLSLLKRVYKYAWNTIEFDGEYRKAMIRERIETWRAFTGTRDIGRARCALSKSYANSSQSALFPPICLAKFCPHVDFDGRSGAARKEPAQKERGRWREISALSHWVTSGEAIFRESESNVTWRGKSEGTDVETVMLNRYFYKRPHTSESAFRKPGTALGVRGARSTQLH